MPNRARKLTSAGAEPRHRGHLTRARIVTAALSIADRHGLGAISMRRVAAELDARPMSLYSYIASKADLLRLMAEEIVAETIVPDELSHDWRQALELIAHRSHDTFVAHPWVLDISGRRPHLGHNALRHAEQLLTAIAPLKLDPPVAWEVLFMINDYTLGHALRVAQARDEPPNSYPGFDPGQFPFLAAALSDPGPERGRETFNAGLEALLDGIEHQYGNRNQSRHQRSHKSPRKSS